MEINCCLSDGILRKSHFPTQGQLRELVVHSVEIMFEKSPYDILIITGDCE